MQILIRLASTLFSKEDISGLSRTLIKAFYACILMTDQNIVDFQIFLIIFTFVTYLSTCDTGPRSAVGNVSGYRCVSDCSSRGRELDPGPVPYFRGD